MSAMSNPRFLISDRLKLVGYDGRSINWKSLLFITTHGRTLPTPTVLRARRMRWEMLEDPP
jgi:hypothetical protein